MRASLRASSSVFHVMGCWQLLRPSQRVSSSLIHFSTSVPYLDSMLFRSLVVNSRASPNLLHFAAISSVTKILRSTPCESLYLKQFRIARSGLVSGRFKRVFGKEKYL